MAKKAQPSTLEETPLPVPEAEPSEVPTPVETEEAKPKEEGEVEPEPKEEKPDFATLLAGLSKDERKALLKENLGEELSSLEQAANDRAWEKLRGEQQRRVQANQELQDTLKNLDGAEDDNKRAGHIQAYADRMLQTASQQWALEALDNLRESLGVSREEHDEIVLRLHQAASRENRVATFGDYVKHVTGEKFMPRQEVKKALKEEVNAILEERLGKERDKEPSPVSLGPGEPSNQEAADNRTLSDPNATGEQKADAFERLYGYRPRNI